MTASAIRSSHRALLSPVRASTQPRGVVLVVHGGRSNSTAPVRSIRSAVVRLRPVAKAIARYDPTLAVYRLQLSVRGWNGTGATAIRDVRWALSTLRDEHPDTPLIIVGHSMGARTAMRTADDPGVAGVVGLASWLPADEPQDQLRDVPIRLVHGAEDRTVPERDTAEWIARAVRSRLDLDQEVLEGTGHGMLGRWSEWHRLAAVFASELVDAAYLRHAQQARANRQERRWQRDSA